MNLAPFTKQTIVSAYSKDDVLKLISSRTQVPKGQVKISNPMFNGVVKKNTFRLSRAITYSQNSLPLTVGHVEDTTRGSIIFLHIKLFPAAILYLAISTGMALGIGIMFIIFLKSIQVGIIAIIIALANYFILNLNFHRKAEETIQSIREILSTDN